MDERFEEKITEALLHGTEEAKGHNDAIWNNIEMEVEKMSRKKTLTPRLFKFAASAAILALVMVFAAATQPGKAAFAKVKEIFVPKKVVVQEVEGQKEKKEVNLQESSKGYVIYFDEQMYTMTRTGTKDRIDPKQKDKNLPDIYMEIEQIKDKNVQTMTSELQGQLKAKYSNVRNIGAVTTPIKGNVLVAQSGNKWNDTVIKYYIIDNTKGGTFIIKQQYFVEASEGHGARFDNMLKEFKIVDLNK